MSNSRRLAGRPERQAEPVLPLAPVLNFDTLTVRPRQRRAIGFDGLDSKMLFLVSGRYGLLRILRDLDLQAGDEVLVPAYHCPALLAPMQALGVKPVLYDVDWNLDPDIQSVHERITDRTRAVVNVHFFGFWRNVAAVREVAKQAMLPIIHDCAHVPITSVERAACAWQDDYFFGSYMKFAPTFDGGFAYKASGWRSSRASRPQGLKAEIRALMTLVERSARFDRVSFLSRPARLALSTQKRIRSALKSSNTKGAPSAVYGGYELDLALEDVRPTRMGRWILKRVNWQESAEKRRRNYLTIGAGLRAVRTVRALYPTLAENEIPYVFPALVSGGDSSYQRLKLLGVPMYRWEDMAPSACRVSAQYASDLFQVPCHQDLTTNDIDFIVQTFKETLGVANLAVSQ